MNINLSTKDVMWSYVGIIMSMASNLLLLPFIAYYLNSEMLGLWYVFGSIGTIAMLFDFGFAVTFARNITYCWSGAKTLQKENVSFTENISPDYSLMGNVLQACRIVYFRISIAALILLFIAGTAYIAYVSRNIYGTRHIWAWIIYAVAIYLNLYYGYYAAFLRGVGAIDAANKNTVIARSLQILVTIGMLALETGIIGACTAYLLYGTVFRVLGKYKFYRYKQIGQHLAKVKNNISHQETNKLIGVVWHNAWRDGIIAISNYFSNQVTILICSLFLTLSETGVYSIAVQIAMAIATIAGTLYTAYQPEIQASYISKDINHMKSVMSLIVISFILLFVIGTIIFILFFMPLLEYIKPGIMVSIPVLLGICTYHFILKFRDIFSSYFSCTNRICYMNGFIVSALLCVGLSFICVGYFHWRIWGLIFAQIISQLIYNVWKWPMAASKEMKLSLNEMIILGLSQLQANLKTINSTILK